MKIVYLITGSGGSFYCGNCYRDMIYLRAIRKVPGIQASAIPLYLPPEDDVVESGMDKNVFFGAISMYLREKVPFLKNMPVFFDKIVDSGPMLRMAAKRAGTTSSEGLEDMTLNMIKGENAFPEKELQRLVDYLCRDGKPDVIHLSNALIIGLARQLKRKIDVKIVCSLLNEDDWTIEMAEPYQSKAWSLIAREAPNVDAFLTPSEYYKKFFISKTGIEDRRFYVVPLGLDPDHDILSVVKKDNWPAIGYFCRINAHNGFDKLVDAFIKLKLQDTLPGLTLHVSGGYTGVDKSFIAEQIRKVKEAGLKSFIRIYPEFHGNSKQQFFSNIDIMSVPVRKYDGYGLYLLEANAAGVPVVQPATGAFPEIVAKTGGGITYSVDDIDGLTEALSNMLNDKVLMAELGAKGKEKVLKELSLEKMSANLSIVYKGLQ
ncbi:MAG: glycosyltransferase family 4 protein [Bacteroidales bacterium]|nr:glycosyltransferase family 4 protein [Bacteroidales bacterium]MBK7627686.1 glycosyltransferase family 4 protein [Bacteroidales bacterium]